jgi:hypothetical protein
VKHVESFDFDQPRKRRPDAYLEFAAAEFLVLGHLLRHRIESHKSYTNMRGYDIVAVNPERLTSARIQVKGRSPVGAPGFPIKNFDSDFVVFVRLNSRSSKRGAEDRLPEVFIFPTGKVKAAWRQEKVGKVYIRDIDHREQYRDAWNLITEFLAKQGRQGR